jgi:hypothetical protein
MFGNHLIDIIGWASSGAVVAAYALVSNHRLDSRSKTYQMLNLGGGIGLVINTLHYGAYPSTFVNIIWTLIAVSALSRVWRPSGNEVNERFSITALKK